MSDEVIFGFLKTKQEDLERRIESYQKTLALLSADLANMRAVLSFHAQDIPDAEFLPHMSVRLLFKRHEIFGYCRDAFMDEGGHLDMRELTRFVIARKGLDPEDAVLRKKIVFSVAQAMKTARRHGLVQEGERRKGVRLWMLTERGETSAPDV